MWLINTGNCPSWSCGQLLLKAYPRLVALPKTVSINSARINSWDCKLRSNDSIDAIYSFVTRKCHLEVLGINMNVKCLWALGICFWPKHATWPPAVCLASQTLDPQSQSEIIHIERFCRVASHQSKSDYATLPELVALTDPPSIQFAAAISTRIANEVLPKFTLDH
jgi:hypothetical protein